MFVHAIHVRTYTFQRWHENQPTSLSNPRRGVSVGWTPINELPLFRQPAMDRIPELIPKCDFIQTKRHIKNHRMIGNHKFPISFPTKFPWLPHTCPMFFIQETHMFPTSFPSPDQNVEALTAKMRMQFEVEDLEVASYLWRKIFGNISIDQTWLAGKFPMKRYKTWSFYQENHWFFMVRFPASHVWLPERNISAIKSWMPWKT